MVVPAQILHGACLTIQCGWEHRIHMGEQQLRLSWQDPTILCTMGGFGCYV